MAKKSRISVKRLVEDGTQCIVQLDAIESQRTEQMVKLAKIIVLLRGKFEYQGNPDWAGRSQAYREAAAKMYQDAGIEADSASNIQSAVRYHIGNELREVLDAEELQVAGLNVESPRERQRNGEGDNGGNSSVNIDGDAPPPEATAQTPSAIDLRASAILSITQATVFVHQARDKLPSDEVEREVLREALANLSAEVLSMLHELGAFAVRV